MAALPATTKHGGYMRIGSSPLGGRGMHWEIQTETLRRFPGYDGHRRLIPWWQVRALCKDVPMALSVEDQQLVHRIRERVEQIKNTHKPPEQPSMFVRATYPPATVVQVETTEAQIGFRLPELIREIYLQVGNGGFGPGYGITGVEGGRKIYEWSLAESVVHCRQARSYFEEAEIDASHWRWEEHYIMYCYWGCNETTIVDCADPSLPVYCMDDVEFVDPDPLTTLRPWWLDWLEGTTNRC